MHSVFIKDMNTSIRIVLKYFFKSPVFMNTFCIHFEYIYTLMSYMHRLVKNHKLFFFSQLLIKLK